VVVAAGLLTVASCSGGGKGDGEAKRPGGEVPDPCAVLAADKLSALAGGDPGVGTVKGMVPEQRKVCVFAGGLSLALEVGEGYEASVDLIKASPSGATIEDVKGVGKAAVWQDFGTGVGQLVANGDRYFVSVMVSAGGREVGEALAGAMLDQL
jgi:hypothetical protein